MAAARESAVNWEEQMHAARHLRCGCLRSRL